MSPQSFVAQGFRLLAVWAKRVRESGTARIPSVMSTTDGRFSTVIRSKLRRRFFAEPNKGKLINGLLERYCEAKDAS
jgi:hypothetical protein